MPSVAAASAEGAGVESRQNQLTSPPRRLRHEGVSECERNFAVAMHLSPLAALLFGPLIFAPLVLWLIRKDESVFDDDHGREVINFGLSQFLIMIILCITVVGILLIPVQAIVVLVNMIRGSVAASHGEYFRYPMTIRFIS